MEVLHGSDSLGDQDLQPFAAGKAFGDVGPYQQLDGTVYFAVDPDHQWSFARLEGGSVVPDATHMYLASGFLPGKVYQVVYTTVGAPVIGLRLLAMRDRVSFLRYGSAQEGNPCAGHIRYAYSFGRSQSGRFLRHFLYLSLNQAPWATGMGKPSITSESPASVRASATASWIRMHAPHRRRRRRLKARWGSRVGHTCRRCVRTERLIPRSLCHGTPLRHGAAKPRQSTSLSLMRAGGPPQGGIWNLIGRWSTSSTMPYNAVRKVSRSRSMAMSPVGKGSIGLRILTETFCSCPVIRDPYASSVSNCRLLMFNEAKQ